MTSYVNSYVEKTHLLRPPLGDVRNQPIKRLMAALIYIYILELLAVYLSVARKHYQKLLGSFGGAITNNCRNYWENC